MIEHGKRILRTRRLIVYSFLVLLATVPLARAQQPQIEALAARVAEEINSKHEKTVVVFDFVGPGKKSTALGQKIAGDFSEALKKSASDFSALDRAEIAQGLEVDRFSSQLFVDVKMKLWLAKQLNAPLMVLGKLEPDGESLNITVDSYSGTDGAALKEFKVAVPLTEQMKALIDTPADTGKDQSAAIPLSGANGYSVPACISCPYAQFSSLAVKNNTQGSVALLIVVGRDGQAHDILVVKGLPDGLTESAIEAVRSWKFKPATGPDGAPADVKMMVEVTFHLEKQRR